MIVTARMNALDLAAQCAFTVKCSHAVTTGFRCPPVPSHGYGAHTATVTRSTTPRP